MEAGEPGDPAIGAHLAFCPKCRIRLVKAALYFDEVATLLRKPGEVPTARCPDDLVLAKYLERLLPPEEQERVRRHLAGCDLEGCLRILGTVPEGDPLARSRLSGNRDVRVPNLDAGIEFYGSPHSEDHKSGP